MIVDEYIEKLDEVQKGIVLKLRELILSVDSEIQEEIKSNVPTYTRTKSICSIIAHKTHVNLQIFNGSKITVSNILEGTGKNMRHIKCHKSFELNISELKKILREAVIIDSA